MWLNPSPFRPPARRPEIAMEGKGFRGSVRDGCSLLPSIQMCVCWLVVVGGRGVSYPPGLVMVSDILNVHLFTWHPQMTARTPQRLKSRMCH